MTPTEAARLFKCDTVDEFMELEDEMADRPAPKDPEAAAMSEVERLRKYLSEVGIDPELVFIASDGQTAVRWFTCTDRQERMIHRAFSLVHPPMVRYECWKRLCHCGPGDVVPEELHQLCSDGLCGCEHAA